MVELLFILLITIGFLMYGLLNLRRQRDKAWDDFSELNEAFSKLLSQKKSSEVRLGFLVEHLAPFLKDFPYDAYDEEIDIIPMGNPIDFAVFTPDEIGLVEVKSGGAQLSPKQRRIRDQVKAGKVVFHRVRVTGRE